MSYGDGLTGILKSCDKSLTHPLKFEKLEHGVWIWEISLRSNHEIMGKYFASREDAERSFRRVGFINYPAKP